MKNINRYLIFFLIVINIICLITVLMMWGSAQGVLHDMSYKPFIFWSGALVNILLLGGIWMILDIITLIYFKLKKRR